MFRDTGAPAPADGPLRSILHEPKGAVDLVAKALALMGVVMYGVVRLGEEVFYRRLGTTPEQVGLTQVESIARSAVNLVGATVLLVAAGLAVSILASALQRITGGRRRRYRSDPSRLGPFDGEESGPPVDERAWTFGPANVLSSIVFAALAIAILAAWKGVFEDRAFAAIAVSVAAFGVLLMMIRYLTSHRRRAFGASLIVVALAASAVAGVAFRGDYLANRVLDGEAVVPEWFDFLGVRATPVCLSPETDAPGLDRTRPHLLLGSSEGTTVLVRFARSASPSDASAPGALRVPSAGLVLEPATPATTNGEILYSCT